MDQIKNKNIWFVLCIAIGILTLSRFFVLYMGADDSILHLLYTWTSRSVAVFVIILYFIKYKKPSLFLIGISLIYLIELLVNSYVGGDLRTLISKAFPIIGFVMLIELIIKKNYEIAIKTINYLFIVLLTLNLCFMLINPNMFGPNRYLISVSNQMGCMIIITCYVTSVYCKEKKDFKLLIYTVLISFITILIGKSVNNLLSFMLILGYMFSHIIRKIFKKIGIVKLIISYFLAFISVVVIRIQNIFSFFIVDILHKSLSLSGRTYIWDIALPSIFKNPILGHGTFVESNYFHVNFVMSNGNIMDAYWSAHNTFIQIAFEFGIIPIIIMIIVIYFVGKKYIFVRMASSFVVCFLYWLL